MLDTFFHIVDVKVAEEKGEEDALGLAAAVRRDSSAGASGSIGWASSGNTILQGGKE